MLSIGYNETIAHINSWISMYGLTYPVLQDQGGSVSTQFIPVVGGYLYFPHNTLIDTWQIVRHTATGFNQSYIQSLMLSLMDPFGSVSVTELEYGEVVVGESSELSFTIDNVGTGILEVTNMVSSCPSFSPNPTSGSVYAVDDLLDVTVTYTPLHAGQCNETLTISTNDGDFIVNLRGVGITSAVSPSEETVIPSTLGLDPCFPNPFNSETVIPYHLPSEANASIAIYSVDGRLVDLIDLGQKSPGNYYLTWSPEQATTGMYFVELRSEGRPVDIKKILYLK